MQVEKFYNEYSSNSIAGTSNQSFFDLQGERTSVAFYKVLKAGEYEYSFLFTNPLDSTFPSIENSVRNTPCGKWTIVKMQVLVADGIEDVLKGKTVFYKDVTFDGQEKKEVLPSEVFCSDPVTLNVSKDRYLCVKITFFGEKIPFHPENPSGIGCWKR